MPERSQRSPHFDICRNSGRAHASCALPLIAERHRRLPDVRMSVSCLGTHVGTAHALQDGRGRLMPAVEYSI